MRVSTRAAARAPSGCCCSLPPRRGAASALGTPSPPHLAVAQLHARTHPALWHALAALHGSLERPATPLDRQSRLATAVRLLLEHGAERGARAASTPTSPPVVRRARAFIEEHAAAALTLDDPPPDGCNVGDCSLREAVLAANAAGAPRTITFDPSTDGRPITLTIAGAVEDAAATGDLDVRGTLTVSGNGADRTIVQACDAAANPSCRGIDRLFDLLTVDPVNDRPTIAADLAAVSVLQGRTATNTGTYGDRDATDDVGVTSSAGHVTKTGTSGGTWSWSFVATVPGDQHVTITANDGDGGTAEVTFALTVLPDADGDADGVVDLVDRNQATGADESLTPSITFRHDPSGAAATFGAITRGGWTWSVAPTGAGSEVRLGIAGAGGTGEISACGSSARLLLGASGQQVDVACGAYPNGARMRVEVVTAPRPVLLQSTRRFCPRFGACRTYTVRTAVSAGQVVYTGSPITADAANPEALRIEILDASGSVVGAVTLAPGQTVGIEADDDRGLVVVNLGPGLLTYTMDGATFTTSPGETISDLCPGVPGNVGGTGCPAPTISGSVSPAPNASGWHRADVVTVTWQVDDSSQTGLSSTGCRTTELRDESATADGASLTCTATNGAGLSTSRAVAVKIDRTAPEAYSQLDRATRGVAVYGRDALSGSPRGQPRGRRSRAPGGATTKAMTATATKTMGVARHVPTGSKTWPATR